MAGYATGIIPNSFKYEFYDVEHFKALVHILFRNRDASDISDGSRRKWRFATMMGLLVVCYNTVHMILIDFVDRERKVRVRTHQKHKKESPLSQSGRCRTGKY